MDNNELKKALLQAFAEEAPELLVKAESALLDLESSSSVDDQQSFADSTLNALVNQVQPNGSYPLTLTHFPNSSIQTLEITIGNPGQLPKWRGVDGLGWLFIDEIEVYGHEK